MLESPAPAHIVEADGLKIDLKNRYVAGFLAFIFPGAGHGIRGVIPKQVCFRHA